MCIRDSNTAANDRFRMHYQSYRYHNPFQKSCHWYRDRSLLTQSEGMQVPRGQRYELCRSVHAEANAIISASRRDMVGSTLYLVGRDGQTGALLGDATSCAMCRRQVINAGITRVIIRRTETEFKVVDVNDWVHQEDDVPAL